MLELHTLAGGAKIAISKDCGVWAKNPARHSIENQADLVSPVKKRRKLKIQSDDEADGAHTQFQSSSSLNSLQRIPTLQDLMCWSPAEPLTISRSLQELLFTVTLASVAARLPEAGRPQDGNPAVGLIEGIMAPPCSSERQSVVGASLNDAGGIANGVTSRQSIDHNNVCFDFSPVSIGGFSAVFREEDSQVC